LGKGNRERGPAISEKTRPEEGDRKDKGKTRFGKGGESAYRGPS